MFVAPKELEGCFPAFTIERATHCHIPLSDATVNLQMNNEMCNML